MNALRDIARERRQKAADAARKGFQEAADWWSMAAEATETCAYLAATPEFRDLGYEIAQQSDRCARTAWAEEEVATFLG